MMLKAARLAWGSILLELLPFFPALGFKDNLFDNNFDNIFSEFL